MQEIIIIGGGISGLSAAWELQQRAGAAVHLTVLEAGDQWGGKLLTQRMTAPGGGEFVVDAGPEAFITRKPAGWRLVRELGIDHLAIHPASAASGTCILENGQPRALPLSPGAFVRSDLLSWQGKLRLLAEPFIPPKRDGADESLAAFVSRRLGPEALERMVGPVLGGIYNSDPQTQSILVTAPIMRELEQAGSLVWGSVRQQWARRRAAVTADTPPFRFAGFAGGMGVLVAALVAQLRGTLRLNAPVVAVERTGTRRAQVVLATGETLSADGVILATPANVAARLLAAGAPAAARLLQRIRHAHIGTLSLAWPRAAVAHTAPMQGLMIPRRERRRIDAITWTSTRMAGRAPDGYALLRVFFGGGDPSLATLGEEALVGVVRQELAELVGISAEPVAWCSARWPDSYPQAAVGHLALVAEIEAQLPALLRVTGSAYRGLALPDCIQQGRDTAAALWQSVR